MQFKKELVTRLPRSRCAEHGVENIVPPWAGKHSRLTLLSEAFGVEVLQACRTVKAAAALLGLSWNAVQTIMNRTVARGAVRHEATPIKHIGIDEKSFWRGQDYITVLTDPDGSLVLDVAPERTQAAAESVLAMLTVGQRQKVCAVAADTLPAYAQAVAMQTPNAELAHDKFHVAVPEEITGVLLRALAKPGHFLNLAPVARSRGYFLFAHRLLPSLYSAAAVDPRAAKPFQTSHCVQAVFR